MDIGKYVESARLEKYLEENQAHLSAAEAAGLVEQSGGIAFEQRCQAFEEIIRNMQDCPFGEFASTHAVGAGPCAWRGRTLRPLPWHQQDRPTL